MNHQSQSKTVLARMAVVAAALSAVASLPAVAADRLPPEHTQGAVTYRSGGIGAQEVEAMKQAAGGYSLAVTFAERQPDGSNAYLAGDRVSVLDHSGKEVLKTTATGPFLLAQLPQGRYTITAWRGKNMKEQAVDIRSGQTQRITFAW